MIAVFWLIAYISADGHPLRASDPAGLSRVVDASDSSSAPNGKHGPNLYPEDVFANKLDDYKVNLGVFRKNLELQALFVVAVLLLLLRRSDKLNVFGNGVPLQWLHMLIPVVLLYLWVSFGFALDNLIESRISLAQMIRQLNPGNLDLAGSVMHDAHFIDGWFLKFVDSPGGGIGDWSYIDRVTGTASGFFLVLFLGTWIAASHAATLAITITGIRRYMPGAVGSRRLLYYFGAMGVTTLFLLSHHQFAYGGNNRNWIQFYIAAMTPVLFAMLIWLSLVVDRTVDRSSLACLKRSRTAPLQDRDKRRTTVEEDLRRRVRVLLMGDSLSTGFYVGGIVPMIDRCWRRWNRSWFISHKSDEIPSIDRRADAAAAKAEPKVLPVHLTNAASASADIQYKGARGIIDWLTNTLHLAHQIDEMEVEDLPDLLVLWIGHNSIDWQGTKQRDKTIEQQADLFDKNFEFHLRRICTIFNEYPRPRVVLVFGMINFPSFFRARARGESLRKKDAKRFPKLEHCYRYFISLSPEHREGMIELAELCNSRIKSCVQRLNETTTDDLCLTYSDALASVDVSDPKCMSPIDAWHPSAHGHTVLADAAWPCIEKALISLKPRWKPQDLSEEE